MINLSFDELRLVAQVRNISGYENKSKEDLIKALSEPKSESPKPEIPKLEIPKLKTPKLISSKLKISKSKIPKPKPRPKIRVNKKKFKKLRKCFDKLRHKFYKKEIDRDRKTFYDVKNYELFNPWIFNKIVLDSLEIPRPKTKTPGNSTFFLGDPLKKHFVFN